MSRASTAQMRNVAKRLMAYETGVNKLNKCTGTKTPVAFHCCEKLRPRLATLMGDAGFRALLSRALANAEHPWLRAVHVKADGSLEGLEDLHAQLRPIEFFEARVVVLAQLLGSLATFIGDDLTLHLVREVWPNIPIDDLDLGKENEGKYFKYEQTN
jgi:hypothetical protein